MLPWRIEDKYMMKTRFMTILFTGLLVLIAALFVFACILSRKQYQANIQFVKADCLQSVLNEGAYLRETMRTIEREKFALLDQDNLSLTSSLSNRLFRIKSGGFVPAALPALNTDGSLSGGADLDENTNMKIREAWRVAGELSQLSLNMKPPFRMPYNDYVLSVNILGQACLMPLDAFRHQDQSNAEARISATDPGPAAAVSRQLRYPPVYVWVPTEMFDSRKQPVDQAYFLTNLMLVAMAALLAGLGYGIALLVKRQHEIAKLKVAFVSSVSHELRTPMALVRLYAESLAADNPLPGTREKYAKAIMTETDRLMALVNNVLDFSRIEKGLFALNVGPADISKICNDVLDSFQVRIEKDGITLTRKIASGVMGMVDALALTQVIFNIMDNAIKYSGTKSAIEVELVRIGADVMLRVSDNGIGISDTLKPRIFMPFVRGDDSRVTSQRGSGIGLSVAAQLIELMNCSITVTDNRPAGSVFSVRIPAADGI